MSNKSTSAKEFTALTAIGIVVLLALPGPAIAADQVATFELTADISWSAETTPLDFPSTAHLSRLIGATHHSKHVLFRDGHTASSGLELVAENGRVATLKAEFTEAKRRGRLGTLIEGPDLPRVPGQISVKFETTETHPLLSFVMMVAPSPDWFTGAADIALMRENQWINEATFGLWAWDSGTDSGQTYSAPNHDTQPQQSIRLLASPHFLGKTGLAPIGTVRVRRVAP